MNFREIIVELAKSLLPIFLYSALFGYAMLLLILHFPKVWKEKKKLKIWGYLSCFGFVLYMFFIGSR